jgi:ABC-2 type transport system ATP-binding protein
MRFTQKQLTLALSILLFFAATILLNIFSFPSSKVYELTAFLMALLLLALFFLFTHFSHDRESHPHHYRWLNKLDIDFSAKERQRLFFYRFLAVLLLLIFIVRTLSKHDYLESVSALQSDFLSPFQVGYAAIFNCWWSGCLLYSLIVQFLPSKTFRAIEKWVVSPILLIIAVALPLNFEGVAGQLEDAVVSPQALMMAVEFAAMAAFALKSWLEDPSWRFDKETGYAIVVAFVLLVMTTINAYLPKNLIGEYLPNVPLAKGFNITHRVFIYLAFLLPILYFLLLYPFDYAHRRAFLFFIAQAVLIGYASIRRIEVWQHFYTMPLHLCNTAMYIMPLTLAFRSHKLFYFTMFINVIGAFLALMMPNYSDGLSVLGTDVMEFYLNHIYASCLPILIVELGIFERPKWKYFGYSMAGFALYFVFVAFLNIYYTGMKDYYHISPPDYFFLNSDFIAKKVGAWAENLWNLNAQWTVNSYTFTLHWPYLISYFVVYTGFALGMWYFYEVLFKSTDELVLIHQRSHLDKIKKLAFMNETETRRASMDDQKKSDEHRSRIEISHFTKYYGTSKTPAVQDFSLTIEGGKIYGFLGKNGAGKSTIIKAIVGMHGFDEGSISVCGYDVIHESVQAKMQIGFVPDNYALYESLTGRQYLNYISDLYGVGAADKEERMTSLVRRLEMGEHLDTQMRTYSHGMKQKITIIAALIHNPKVWILDEPMTGLDPNSIFQIKECMREHAKKGNIVFFSSHLIDVVENLCDEIVIIKHGRFVLSEKMSSLTAKGVDLEALFLEKTADDEKEADFLIAEEKKFSK